MAHNIPILDLQNVYECDFSNLIGLGHFGKVYRAIRRADQLTCAIKVIPIDDNVIHHALNEYHIHRLSVHPNIIRVLDIGRSEDSLKLYIVMEIGENQLLTYLQQRAKLSERECREIVRQLLSALLFLHNYLHVAHRDLKPENILVSIEAGNPQVKIIDFGSAKYFGRLGDVEEEDVDRSDSLSRNQTLVECEPAGTPMYAPYETITALVDGTGQYLFTPRRLVSKIDIFSVGVLAFIMLCGKFPFCRESENVQLTSLRTAMSRGVKCVPIHWDGVSQEAQHFVKSLLDINPEKRPTVKEAALHSWMSVENLQKELTPIQDITSINKDASEVQNLVTNEEDPSNS